MPSLYVAVLPTSLLVLLRDRLAPLPATSPGTLNPLTIAGFQGWHSTDVATSGAAPVDTVATGTKWFGHAQLHSGLAGGCASMADARLSLQMVLLWKCQIDDSALAIVGGCAALKAVRTLLHVTAASLVGLQHSCIYKC